MFYLVWQRDGALLQGLSSNQWQAGEQRFPISYPATTTEAEVVQLRTSARDAQTTESLKNVKFYLAGSIEDRTEVQVTWPANNGGFELSFDAGRTWIRFSLTIGWQDDPSTWVPLPAAATGFTGVDGTLMPFDLARILVRYVVPAEASQFRVYDLELRPDGDVS